MNKTEKEYKTKIFKLQELKQVKTNTSTPRFVVRSPEDIAKFFMNEIGSSDREKFIVAYLNTKNVIIGYEIAFVGSLNASVVHPRETFKAAILNNSASIIVGHCHPSNNCAPSPEDIQVTERLKKAGDIIGIELLDHIIVGESNFISLKEKGYL